MRSPIVLARTAIVVVNSPSFVIALNSGVRCCSLGLKTPGRGAWTHRTVVNRTGKEGLFSVSRLFSTDSTSTSTPAGSGDKGLADRIYEIVGRDFDIGKPSILSKVIFEEMRVSDTHGRTKSRSVSAASLSAILEVEDDHVKRELLQLVLGWLSAKAMEKRGGFIAFGAKVADMPDWTSRVIPDHDDLPVDASALPVVLIDGHYLIFRSFYAMPTLTAPDGAPVGALVGFCNIINKLVLRPWADGSYPHRRVVVALDTGMDTFRHKLYPGYKADRAETPEDLRLQFALIKRACEAYGLDVLESEGYEADDVIASLALQAVTAGATNVTIVSADKDLAQLVTRRVNMFNCYTGEMLGPEEVLTKFLAPPGRLADLLAIAGDKADGIRGAEGYGPVTAAKVLARHSNLEDAVNEICSTMLKKKKDPALVSDTREQVLLARRVVELCPTVPLESRQGYNSLHAQAPYGLTPGDGPSRLLAFMRDAATPDLRRRTAQILGVDENGSLKESLADNAPNETTRSPERRTDGVSGTPP